MVLMLLLMMMLLKMSVGLIGKKKKVNNSQGSFNSCSQISEVKAAAVANLQLSCLIKYGKASKMKFGERDNQVGNISRDSNDNLMSVDEDIGDKRENFDSGVGEGVQASDDGDHVNVEEVVMNGMEDIIGRILGKVGIGAEKKSFTLTD